MHLSELLTRYASHAYSPLMTSDPVRIDLFIGMALLWSRSG